jgi:hypothetical protein
MCMELHLELSPITLLRLLTQLKSVFSDCSRRWRTSCNLSCACRCRARLEWRLTTLLANTTVVPIAAPKKKSSLLPLLTVVFLASYGLMTMLIVLQGTTIQAQQNLIQVLLGDSRELWAMKGKAVSARAALAQRHAPGSATETPSTPAPLTQGRSPSVAAPAPSVQAPSIQAPSTPTPSTQAAPPHHSRSGAKRAAKPQTQVPPMPASDLGDRRRALNTL